MKIVWIRRKVDEQRNTNLRNTKDKDVEINWCVGLIEEKRTWGTKKRRNKNQKEKNNKKLKTIKKNDVFKKQKSKK